MSLVSYVKIKEETLRNIENCTRLAMNLINWGDKINGHSIFIKINAMSDELMPGRCTAPWVLGAVLKEIRSKKPDCRLFVGDADVAGSKQLEKSIKHWGFDKVSEYYGAKFINLSEEEIINVKFPEGRLFKEIPTPKILTEVDHIINIPVAKTHCLTTITACLKNHWGLLPRFRHNFHPVVNDVISEINTFFQKTVINIIDGTVCMEGNGPKTGMPVICNFISASADRVSLDSFIAEYMGFDPCSISHIVKSNERGVGEIRYELIGDSYRKFVNSFVPPNMKGDVVMLIEMNLRKIPIIKQLIFKTHIFSLAGWGGTNYNKYIWYNFFGKKFVKKRIFDKSRLYRFLYNNINDYKNQYDNIYSNLRINTNCLCGNNINGCRILFDLNEYQKLLQCPKCGVIFNDCVRKDIDVLYTDHYFENGGENKYQTGGYYNYNKLEIPLNKDYSFAKKFIDSKTKEAESSCHLIDIGCGYGFFLKQFANNDKLDICGVELNRKAAQEAQKKIPHVINGSFEEALFDKKFNFVLMFEVIEHLTDPVNFMKKVLKITKKGSYLVLSTPDISSLSFIILKTKWPAIHPETHNYYFTPKTLERFLGSYGFKKVSITRKGFLRKDVYHLRKKLSKMFPSFEGLFNVFRFLDNKIIFFPSGGSMNCIFKKTA